MTPRTVCALVRLAGLGLIVWSVIAAGDYLTAGFITRDTQAMMQDTLRQQQAMMGTSVDMNGIMAGPDALLRWSFIGIAIRFVCGFILLLIAPLFASYAVGPSGDAST